MIINSNPAAMSSARVLAASNTSLAKSLARLSSGSRIVSPEDDAAGLAVSTKFKSELVRIGAARTNVGNATSFSQTQDGFLKSVDTALRRMSELTVLASDQTKHASDVENYDKEFVELKSFITRTAGKQFNGVGLFAAGSVLADIDLDNDAVTVAGYGTETGDARVSTQYIALGASSTAATAGTPTDGAAVTGFGVHATVADVFLKTAHGFAEGDYVTASAVTGVITTNVTAGTGKLYVHKLNADNFELYTDKAMTTKATCTAGAAAGTFSLAKAGTYDSTLTTLRVDMAEMAAEWLQKETNSTTEATYATTQSWGTTYDFWASRLGKNWTGVRDSSAATRAITADVVGDGSVTASVLDAYKTMAKDIQSYILNSAAGLTVTDSSNADTYQMKGVSVSNLESAILTSGNSNYIGSALTKGNAEAYTDKLSNLITDLATNRAYVGANISRLNNVDAQLAIYNENLAAANSRIEDIDVAVESSNYAKQQILVQSGTAMLAQANTLPQNALRLLQ